MIIEMRTSAERDWLRVYAPRPSAAVRLVCFPHAGGNAAFYRPWCDRLPSHVELHAVQYPGRMDRLGTPLIRTMDEMADGVAAAVTPLAHRGPVVLFGHSLGASVAFETARRLTEVDAPAAVVVSGRPAPHLLRDTAVHLSDDDTLWAEMGRLGGTADELHANPAVRELTLPVLRADYEVAETYKPETDDPLPAPILAFTGTDDPEVTRAEAEAWASHTRAGFRLVTFPGAHFYLTGREPAVISALVSTVDALAAGGCP